MDFVDEDLFSVAEALVPLEAVARRLHALQHDHFVETPELLREVGRVRATLDSTLKTLPEEIRLKYLRLYAELHWVVAMTLFSAADSERSGEGSLFDLLHL